MSVLVVPGMFGGGCALMLAYAFSVKFRVWVTRKWDDLDRSHLVREHQEVERERKLAVQPADAYGYSVYQVRFAPTHWAWTAYGPLGREDGQADGEQTARSVASSAMRRLRGCSS